MAEGLRGGTLGDEGEKPEVARDTSVFLTKQAGHRG